MRNQKFDFVKGLLMLGVIFGHILTAVRPGGEQMWLHTFVRTYDMPFFMLISGTFLRELLHKHIWWKYGVNKIVCTLIPTATWTMIYMIIRWIVNKDSFSIFTILEMIFSYWFLWSAVACAIIFIICEQFVKNVDGRKLIYVLVAILFHLIENDMFNLSYMFPFFSIGFYCKEILGNMSIKTICRLKNASVIIFIVCLCFWSNEYTIWNAGGYVLKNTVQIIFASGFRFLIGLTGSISMWSIMDMLDNFVTNESKIKMSIVYLGTQTKIIYIWHAVVTSVVLPKCVSIATQILKVNVFMLNDMLTCLVIVPIMAYIIAYVIGYVVKRIKRFKILSKVMLGANILKSNN